MPTSATPRPHLTLRAALVLLIVGAMPSFPGVSGALLRREPAGHERELVQRLEIGRAHV